MPEHSFIGQGNHPIPQDFPSPFDLQPHPLAELAAQDLQRQLRSISPSEHDFFAADGGKMFGVLVVQRSESISNDNSVSDVSYLSAFSGMLAGKWNRPGFAPPVFDLAERKHILGDGEARLETIASDIEALLQSPERVLLQQQLDRISARRQHVLSEAKRRLQQRRQQRHELRHKIDSTQRVMDELALQSQRDKAEYKALKHQWDQKLARVQLTLEESDKAIASLRKERKALSRHLQQQLFSGYRLPSYNGLANKNITEFFTDALPPGGTGDCASIKLLNSCYQYSLKPVCMAEFWWGASPPGGVRHHQHFYPACRGKCRPVLPHMLSGLNVRPPRYEVTVDFPSTEPHTLFEDNHLLVLVKPAGMLSVAGKTITDSVENRLQSRYPGLVPDKLSRMLVHRLDQATSGLMVAAKSMDCHKSLHQQFERRQVDKRYVAVVDGLINHSGGVVELPLRVDLDDRPRQMVCHQHGKSAKTRYRVLSSTDRQTRLHLFPVTGRTHQLRVHLAHTDGLNTPIAGDELYGNAAERLYLHAEQISFTHPVTGERVSFESPAPF